jgi:hypothetical protein
MHPYELLLPKNCYFSMRVEKSRLSIAGYTDWDDESAGFNILGYPMNKETKLTEREQLELQERRLDGEFDRRHLIRFGYLSVAERRRLREVYPERKTLNKYRSFRGCLLPL